MNPVSLLLLASIGFLLVFWIRSLPAHKRAKAVILTLLVTLALFILLLAFTGRLHWIAAVFAALMPFLPKFWPLLFRFIPFFGKAYRKRQEQQIHGKRSEIKTRIITMQLDQDSGVMYGTISQGPFAGKSLGDLAEAQFIELLIYCREQDSDSARLLETYLDKRFGASWREDEPDAGQNNTFSSSAMTVQEAYKVIGLTPKASKQEIIDTYRRLMQKNHPDRGGSDYLAAKITQARDLLLEQHRPN